MPTIQVDEDVFTALQKHAVPLVDTPNSTLRRILGIGQATPPKLNGSQRSPSGKLELDLSERDVPHRSKAPKADLKALIAAGSIRNGQQLFLVDYRGSRIPHAEAIVATGSLGFKGKHYSMSDLARELLKKEGYESDSVRGPAHWVTSSGTSVKDLWQAYLGQRAKG